MMKSISKLSAATFLLSVAALSANAQGARPAANSPRPAAAPVASQAPATNAPVPESKIAFIDTSAFADEKTGILRFVGALQSIQRELKPKVDELQSIQAKAAQLAKDLDTLSKTPAVSQQSIQSKQDEGERLQREFKYKKEDYDSLLQKRYREVVGPVSVDIGKELDAFAAQRGLTMILDMTKLADAILTAKRETDITAAFIAYYNAKNPATAAATTPRP
jgi:Skp family chaperone for outer membrane proteins